MRIKSPVRYVPKEALIVDSVGVVVCHIFVGRGERVEQADEKGREVELALNHICDSIPVESETNKPEGKRRGNPNFQKGKPNPYREKEDALIEKEEALT